MFDLFTSPACESVGAVTDKPCAAGFTNLLTYPSIDTRIVTTASVHTAIYSRDELAPALLKTGKKRANEVINEQTSE